MSLRIYLSAYSTPMWPSSLYLINSLYSSSSDKSSNVGGESYSIYRPYSKSFCFDFCIVCQSILLSYYKRSCFSATSLNLFCPRYNRGSIEQRKGCFVSETALPPEVKEYEKNYEESKLISKAAIIIIIIIVIIIEILIGLLLVLRCGILLNGLA